LAIFSDLQVAIIQTVYLDPWQGEQLASAINEQGRALCGHSIEVVSHWVPGHCNIHRNEEANLLVNQARDGCRFEDCCISEVMLLLSCGECCTLIVCTMLIVFNSSP
jgi:hypothetical protein